MSYEGVRVLMDGKIYTLERFSHRRRRANLRGPGGEPVQVLVSTLRTTGRPNLWTVDRALPLRDTEHCRNLRAVESVEQGRSNLGERITADANRTL